MKGQKKILHANENQKRSVAAMEQTLEKYRSQGCQTHPHAFENLHINTIIPPHPWFHIQRFNQPSDHVVTHYVVTEKKMHISRLMQFKPVSFKGQLYLYKKKIDFKPKTIKPEDHYIMILGSINQED